MFFDVYTWTIELNIPPYLPSYFLEKNRGTRGLNKHIRTKKRKTNNLYLFVFEFLWGIGEKHLLYFFCLMFLLNKHV